MNNSLPFIGENNVIPANQYGFTAGISVDNQLIDLLYLVYDVLNQSNYMCIDLVFVDFSNAFDTIPHLLLFNELSKIGICDKFYDLLYNFYQMRKQFVNVRNCN